MRWTDLFSVAIGVGAFLALHVLIWRARPSNAPQIILLGALGAAGMAGSALASAVLSGFSVLRFFSAAWVASFFVVLYMFIYAGVSRSVSITLLARLQETEGESLEFAELVIEYGKSSRFEDRIRLMDKSGLIRLAGGRVSLTPKGAALARRAKTASRILGTHLQG